MTCDNTEDLLRAYLHRTLGVQEDTWTMRPSGLSGRGLYATRHFQPGQLVFHDRPVVWGPRAKATVPLCASCHREGRVTNCPAGCYLPVCSPECSTSELHVRECRLIRENMDLPARSWRLDLVGTITPVRCLFLSEEDKEVVRCLQGNVGARHEREIDLLKSFMKEKLKEEDEKWMRLCCRAMDTNAYEFLRSNEDGSNSASLRALYPLAAFLNHECSPNTSHHYNRKGVMKVFATRPIMEGEELTASYGALLWATTFRRIHLNQSKDFMCRCLRCADPTAAKLQVALGVEMDKYGAAEPLEVARYLAHSSLPFCQVNVQLKSNLIWQLGHREGLTLPELSQDILDLKESFCRDIIHLIENLKLGLCRAKGLVLMELHGALCEQLRRQRKSKHPTRDGIEAEIQTTMSAANIISGDDAASEAELNRRMTEQIELLTT